MKLLGFSIIILIKYYKEEAILLNYIRSELYRTFKTPFYSGFLIFSIFTIIIMISILIFNKMPIEIYFFIMKGLSTLVIFLITVITSVLTYKLRDIKIQILGKEPKDIN